MNPLQLMRIAAQVKQNPAQFFAQNHISLPQGINMNDPQAIINHLVSSGRFSQQQINEAYRLVQQMGGK